MKKETSLVIVKDSDWYKSLVEDCLAIVTETIFNSRYALIEGYHALGERIREEDEKKVTDIVFNVAKDLKMTERNVWYAVQFYDKFPKLDKLPDGKNASWTKIKKLLADPKKVAECAHPEFVMIKFCSKCNKKVDE